LAGTGAILAVPHPAEPTFLPPPLPDPRALTRARLADEALADQAELEPLDADIRALGSALRAYGAADAAGDPGAIVKSRKDVATAAARALALGEEEVLRLRAYQLRTFLREVRTWEITGIEGPDLTELGGGFTGMLERNGWVLGRRVLLSDAALRAAFKRRWNEVTGIERPPFQPTLDEHRAFYRFVLEHPIGPPGAPIDVGGGVGDPEAARGPKDQYRLKKIDEIAALDPAYPSDLARGIVLYRLGRFLPAVQAFRRHLEASPDGPFTLRARGYLRAALGRASDVEGVEQ
jgi:tetratricopeptide (TPR) repeat protein